MSPQSKGPMSIDSESIINKTYPERDSSFVRGMDLILEDPRHSYAPTPFDAWRLRVKQSVIRGSSIDSHIDDSEVGVGDLESQDSETVNFIVYGNDEIIKRIDDSLANMPTDCYPRDESVEFFKIANLGAFANRIDKNSSMVGRISGIGERDYNRLALGTGTPSELSGIFAKHYKELLSLELAKQTVGMRWNQTGEMDEAVFEAAVDNGYDEGWSDSRYYYTGGISRVGEIDTKERAGIYVRKQEVASKPVDGGKLVLMQRDSFMVDFTHDNMRDLLPSFCKWYENSLNEESSGGDDYVHFERKAIDEEAVIKLIRANSQRSASKIDSRGGSGLKTPIFGGQATDYQKNFGSVVANRIESTMSSMASMPTVEYSNSRGIYPANRSYYLYHKKDYTNTGQ